MKYDALRISFAAYEDRIFEWQKAIYSATTTLVHLLREELAPNPEMWSDAGRMRNYVEMRGLESEPDSKLTPHGVPDSLGPDNEFLARYTIWAESAADALGKQGLVTVIAIKMDGVTPRYAKWDVSGARTTTDWMTAEQCVQAICSGIEAYLSYDPATLNQGRQIGFL